MVFPPPFIQFDRIDQGISGKFLNPVSIELELDHEGKSYYTRKQIEEPIVLQFQIYGG
jgi:hypothetical protein